MRRDPTTLDLIAFICTIQPELTERAARRILMLTPAIREEIAQDFTHQRDRAESLLELHLTLEETPA